MKNKGISLIVLVITIIVMIILAAAIIISLNNTGIIGNANKAVDETNEKTIQEIANVAWGEAYANGARNVDKLKEAVEKSLENNNLNLKDYGINVTENGVDVARGWLQTKERTVVKGDQVLNIGDIVNYDETNGGKVSVLTDVGWKVLGAQNGNLIIMSDKDVTTKAFNENKTEDGGKLAYSNGINELNDACKVYGEGIGAIEARSITIEDVDRVTGYDKTTYEQALDKLGTTQISYGENITYYLDTTTDTQKKPYYETEKGQTGNLIDEHTKFIYHDGKAWQEITIPISLPTQKTKICTLKNDYYFYEADKKTTLKQEDKAYKLLFGNGDFEYWLASPIVYVGYGFAGFGLRLIYNNKVSGTAFVKTNGEGFGGSVRGIRAVVVLDQDISLTGSSDTSWKI